MAGAPVAGFYFYADPYQGPGHTSSGLVDFREPAWPAHVKLWKSFLDPACTEGLPDTPWACALANYSHPFVTVPVFVTEAQSDAVVLTAHDWVPNQEAKGWSAPVTHYLKQWSHNMTSGKPVFSSLPLFLLPVCLELTTRFGAT